MLHWDSGALTGRESDRSGAAPASEFGLAGEPEWVANLGQQRRRDDRSDAGLVT